MSYQRRIAASILKCGESRVWINQDPKVKQAITRRDVRNLIAQGIIKKLPEKVAKRKDSRFKLLQKSKGRRSGHGSRKGAAHSRRGAKEEWLKIVRPQRRTLKKLREEESIDVTQYRKIYKMIKGRFFRSKAHLLLYLKEKGIAKK